MAANQRSSEITHRSDYPGYRCSPCDCSTHNDCHGRSTAPAAPAAHRLADNATGLGDATDRLGSATTELGRAASWLGWATSRLG